MKKITTMLGFSRGHWDHAEAAHGDKRNPADFARWRELSKIGKDQRDRHMLSEQADILEVFHGSGNLEPIDESWETI